MNARNKLLALVLMCAVSMATASFARAHHLWLNATRYNIEEPSGTSSGEKTTVYFGWGDY